MSKDRSGVNNPMFGKAKFEETLAKLKKMVWVYDMDNNYKLLGVFLTVMCTKTFHIGYKTLTKRLQDGKIHKGKYFSNFVGGETGPQRGLFSLETSPAGTRNPFDKENF